MAIEQFKLAMAQTGLLTILSSSIAVADPAHNSAACALRTKPVGSLLWDKTGGGEHFAVYLALKPMQLASESAKPEACTADRVSSSSEPSVIEKSSTSENAKPGGAPWAAYVLGKLGN